MNLLKSLSISALILLVTINVKASQRDLNAAINNVTKTYMGIKNALVANKATEAENNALDMVKAINAVPVKDMNDAQQKVWTATVNKLLFDSRHISESNPVDHKREHFATLSTNWFSVLKVFKANTGALYKQYCPMKKAYWISETTAVKNPYYGTGSMETCGETKETLKGN